MLRKKLLRTIGKYRAQFISMVIMTALGIGVFVGFNMEWYSIEQDCGSFFERTGFADYRIIEEKGFSEEQRNAVRSIPGVEKAAGYFCVNTSVKDTQKVVALTVTEDPEVSGFIITDGGAYDPDSEDGLWVSDKFAQANSLKTGDSLTLTLRGTELKGRIKGLVKSGEYLICVPDETQLMPDYNNYGYAYASPALLKKAAGSEFYPQINVITGMDKKSFVEKADGALGTTPLIVPKEDTVSFSESQGEAEEGKVMGSVLPVLFLAIAVLTMVTTMHRLTASEKTQIGTLKSLGFKNRRIALHYVSFAVIIGAAGTIFGLLIGWGLGYYIMNPDGAMGTYIDMDDWSLKVPLFVWITLIAVNVSLWAIGFLSVRTMLRGTAADTLRPYAPKKVRKLFAERFGFWKKLSFGTKWNLRDTMRHKARTGMTLFGTVGCVVLLIGGLGMQDTLNDFVKTFYDNAIGYETKINLDQSASPDAVIALSETCDGDRCAQSSVQISDSPVGLEIYGIRRGLVKFVDMDKNYVTLSDDGCWVCLRIAREYSLKEGDSLSFSPYGSDKTYEVRVAGILRTASKTLVMTEKYAESIGIDYVTNVIYTSEKNVAQSEIIINTQTRSAVIESFDTFVKLMDVMIVLLVAAAVILGIVVLYNLGVMSYTERYREMATLKVIGFKDARIGRLLVGENMWLSLIGLILGIPCGLGVLKYLLDALASEYEMSLAVAPRSYVISSLITFGVSLAVGLMISRKNKKIDMVEALKVSE